MAKTERRLAAIMFTDMVGYTTLAQKDESLSLSLVEEQRRLIRSRLQLHGGREVKTMGDAFLVEFPSALNAVKCAYEIQKAVREFNRTASEPERLHLRIGVHLGDIVDSHGDISGDAVNVASRIETLADDGGVCLTRQVYDHVENKFELRLQSLGLRTMKNVRAPMEIYRMQMPWETQATEEVLELDPLRVAVLPLKNMSPDPNDEYFADGMTEELITALSGISELTVIARTSVMQYKNSLKRVVDVGKELKTGTVIEGSVRKAANKVRITIQMVNSKTEGHLWAQNYDRQMDDIFAVQSEIAEKVAGALKLKLLDSERQRLEKRPTESTEAYGLYLKGRYYLNERTKEGFQKALRYFTEATRIDPEYARAYVGLCDCYGVQENWGYISPIEAHAKIVAYTTQALELDPLLGEAHMNLGSILSSREWDIDGAEREFKRAIELDPKSSTAHQRYAFGILGPQGRHEEALRELREAERLDPLSPIISVNVGDQLRGVGLYLDAERQYRSVLESSPNFAYAHAQLGLALLGESRFDEAISEIQESMKLSDDRVSTMADLVCAYWTAGRKEDAERVLAELELKAKQGYVSNVTLAMANGAAGKNDRAIEFLQKALTERSNQIRANLREPHFDQLRNDPRFKSIEKTVGIKNTN